MKAYEDMSGEIEPDLHFEPVPDELEHVLDLYHRIGSPTYQEVKAFESVTGVEVREFELECLREIKKAVG